MRWSVKGQGIRNAVADGFTDTGDYHEVPSEGLEPPTPWSEAKCSIR